MATAWYKPSTAARLLRAFPRRRANANGTVCGDGDGDVASSVVEVWQTTCIVTNFGKGRPGGKCSVLINPANPQLSGVSKFPYFPRGGPVPKEYPKKDAHHIMGYVSQWGGMEVGSGMLFPANVVDGLVHQLGGWKLALLCRLKGGLGGKHDDDRCPVGSAVATGPGGAALAEEYDVIVHAVPPFRAHHPDPERALADCYREALAVAFSPPGGMGWWGDGADNERAVLRRVACPLLGAGCRGFSVEEAARVAAAESVRWRDASSPDGGRGGGVLAFGIPEMSTAERLIDEIELLA